METTIKNIVDLLSKDKIFDALILLQNSFENEPALQQEFELKFELVRVSAAIHFIEGAYHEALISFDKYFETRFVIVSEFLKLLGEIQNTCIQPNNH